jgi:hypothetical protein
VGAIPKLVCAQNRAPTWLCTGPQEGARVRTHQLRGVSTAGFILHIGSGAAPPQPSSPASQSNPCAPADPSPLAGLCPRAAFSPLPPQGELVTEYQASPQLRGMPMPEVQHYMQVGGWVC